MTTSYYLHAEDATALSSRTIAERMNVASVFAGRRTEEKKMAAVAV